jgi:rhodanese-related sulfurtransferase
MAAQDSRRLTLNELLAQARTRIHRRSPADAWAGGGQIIDIRSADRRRADGVVPGALWFPRNVLEWRVDPASEHRDPAVGGLEDEILLLCEEGYQSTLAAAVMRDLGFSRAGDVIDGFRGWRAAGLPIEKVHRSKRWRRVGR